MPRQTFFPAVLLVAALLAACTEATAPADRPQAEVPAAKTAEKDDAPPEPHVTPPRLTLAGEWLKSAPGSEAKGCFTEQARPAVVETVTEHVLVEAEERDAKTGAVTNPASYRTTSQARIVSGGEKMWFASVCETDLTPERIATLQRALAVRGLFLGPVSGKIDAATREAIRTYQSQRGLISPVLSLRAARELGLVLWSDPPPPAPEPAPAAKPAQAK